LKGNINENSAIMLTMKHGKEACAVSWDEKSSPIYLRKLHIRLGHRHLSIHDSDCEYCLAVKTAKQKFKKFGSNEIMEGRVFADLIGPLGGESATKGYVAVIVVDESDETIAIILDSKGEFFQEFMPVAKRIERAYNQSIKKFQCDGGGSLSIIKWRAGLKRKVYS
jgi:hypothetical protein